MIQKTNKNVPRRNKYILENILLNIFKFYILKCIIKFLQSHDNNKQKNSAFIISRNTGKEPVQWTYRWSKSSRENHQGHLARLAKKESPLFTQYSTLTIPQRIYLPPLTRHSGSIWSNKQLNQEPVNT